MSKTRKNKSHKSNNYKIQINRKTKKNNKTTIKTQDYYTARIIIKDNVGGIVADKDTIKEILENNGFKVKVVIYNDIKNS